MLSLPLELEAWRSFFATLASATATLAGLLFVALSFNLELLLRDEHQHTKRVATQTFAIFLYVLIVALLLLMPHGTRLELALEVAAVAIVGLAGTVRPLLRTLRASPGTAFRRHALQQFAGSLAVFLAMVLTAVGVIRHAPWAVHWLAFVLVGLLVVAARRAWYLLVTVRLLGS
jgi:hypothetical protein